MIFRVLLYGLALAFVPFLARAAPESAVFRLARQIDGTRHNCTAVLVAPRTALTAGHCVGPPEPSGRWRRNGPSVYAGWIDGAADQAIRLVAWTRATPTTEGGPWYRHDLAAITLAGPSVGVAPLPVGPAPQQGADVTILSYPKAKRDGIDRQVCKVTQARLFVFQTDCPARSGMSGAPVLQQTAEGWQVVGILVARFGPRQGGGSIAVNIDPALLP